MPIRLYIPKFDPIIIAVSISLLVHFCVIVIPAILASRESSLKDYTLVQLVDVSKHLNARKRRTISLSNAITDSTPVPRQRTVAPEPEQDDNAGADSEDYSGYVPFFKVMKLPEFKVQVRPAYPPRAKLSGIEATVIVEVYIDVNGRPRKTVVIKSGGAEFDQATMEALSNSLFSPALSKDGTIVPVRVRIPYKFEIE